MFKKISSCCIVIILFIVFFLTLLQFSYAGYDDFTVNVPNAQGGYTAIVIKKSGDGYVSPQGEYYAQFPSVAQLQAMYRLGIPNPAVINPVSYVQPQVQSVVAYQAVNQGPYDESDEDYVERPVYQPSIIEIENSSYPKEKENVWTFFEFKKKKKSQKPQTGDQNTPKSTNPSVDNKPQKQTQGTNSLHQDLNKEQLSPKHKDDVKPIQGGQAQPSAQTNQANNVQGPTGDKFVHHNNTGSSP